MPGQVRSEQAAPDTEAVDAQEAARARRMVATLPEKQKLSVSLRIEEGLSFKEIGEIIGSSEGAARVPLLSWDSTAQGVDAMSDVKCETVREWIPDYVGGRLAKLDGTSVESHLKACDECRAEVGLARLVFESRVEAPDGLANRVRDAVRYDRTSVSGPWWGITAAAVAALALGIGIFSDRPEEPESGIPGYAYELENGYLWISDDGLIAGAPALDALSDEALLRFLDELHVGGVGGSA